MEHPDYWDEELDSFLPEVSAAQANHGSGYLEDDLFLLSIFPSSDAEEMFLAKLDFAYYTAKERTQRPYSRNACLFNLNDFLGGGCFHVAYHFKGHSELSVNLLRTLLEEAGNEGARYYCDLAASKVLNGDASATSTRPLFSVVDRPLVSMSDDSLAQWLRSTGLEQDTTYTGIIGIIDQCFDVSHLAEDVRTRVIAWYDACAIAEVSFFELDGAVTKPTHVSEEDMMHLEQQILFEDGMTSNHAQAFHHGFIILNHLAHSLPRAKFVCVSLSPKPGEPFKCSQLGILLVFHLLAKSQFKVRDNGLDRLAYVDVVNMSLGYGTAWSRDGLTLSGGHLLHERTIVKETIYTEDKMSTLIDEHVRVLSTRRGRPFVVCHCAGNLGIDSPLLLPRGKELLTTSAVDPSGKGWTKAQVRSFVNLGKVDFMFPGCVGDHLCGTSFSTMLTTVLVARCVTTRRFSNVAEVKEYIQQTCCVPHQFTMNGYAVNTFILKLNNAIFDGSSLFHPIDEVTKWFSALKDR